MLGFERRWAAQVMGGFAVPDATAGLAPRTGEVDWATGVERFLARASVKGRLGVRLGLLLVVTAPLWCWGRLRSFGGLEPARRAALLDQLLAHRVFAVRELCLLLKLVACMTLFGTPSVRERCGYDPPRRADERGRRALPLAREVA